MDPAMQTYGGFMPLPGRGEKDPWAWSVSGSPLAHMGSQVGNKTGHISAMMYLSRVRIIALSCTCVSAML